MNILPANKLGAWTQRQRLLYHSDKLTKRQVRHLESLPNWTWDVREQWWLDSYYEFTTFYGDNKDYPHQHRNEKEQWLAEWVMIQRVCKRKGTLSESRTRLLDELPYWTWNPHASIWSTKLALLTEFVKINDHMPSRRSSDTQEKQTAIWVDRQRRLFKQGRIDQKQIVQLEAINGWTWDGNNWDGNWDNNLQLLASFVKTNDRLPVRTDSEKDLHYWASDQRKGYRNGELNENRKQKLESIKGWAWEPSDSRWMGMLAQVEEFYKQYTRYPSRSESATSHEMQIGTWLSSQRKNKRLNNLAEDKVELLSTLPYFQWDVDSGRWDDNCEYTKTFVKQFDRLPSSNSQDAKERSVGIWLIKQRALLNNAKLSDEQSLKLKSLPCFDIRPLTSVIDERWEAAYRLVKNFIAKYGRCPTKTIKDASEAVLGQWLQMQRTRKINSARSKITPEQIAKLESLTGFMWECVDNTWSLRYEECKEYFGKYGKRPAASKIGTWTQNQITRYNNGKLAKDRIEKLEKIRGWSWKCLDANRKDNFEFVRSFLTTHKRYPSKDSSDKDEQRLGIWVQNRKQRNKNGYMDKDEILLLESLPNWQWDQKMAAWNDKVSLLIDFVKTHSRLPQQCQKDKTSMSHKLAQWICEQRKLYRNNQLDKFRITQLESVPMWQWEIDKVQLKEIARSGSLARWNKNGVTV